MKSPTTRLKIIRRNKAALKIFSFSIHGRVCGAIYLAVHLRNRQRFQFKAVNIQQISPNPPLQP